MLYGYVLWLPVVTSWRGDVRTYVCTHECVRSLVCWGYLGQWMEEVCSELSDTARDCGMALQAHLNG